MFWHVTRAERAKSSLENIPIRSLNTYVRTLACAKKTHSSPRFFHCVSHLSLSLSLSLFLSLFLYFSLLLSTLTLK
ncbi:hypothetical protein RIF29_36878 [Crotalaria pallida]|uniref:Uncharacterized protein n=1 Tax=Crotalaria pallida TaxID=3830 RepID=A0AAN9EBY9_CROPI